MSEFDSWNRYWHSYLEAILNDGDGLTKPFRLYDPVLFGGLRVLSQVLKEDDYKLLLGYCGYKKTADLLRVFEQRERLTPSGFFTTVSQLPITQSLFAQTCLAQLGENFAWVRSGREMSTLVGNFLRMEELEGLDQLVTTMLMHMHFYYEERVSRTRSWTVQFQGIQVRHLPSQVYPYLKRWDHPDGKYVMMGNIVFAGSGGGGSLDRFVIVPQYGAEAEVLRGILNGVIVDQTSRAGLAFGEMCLPYDPGVAQFANPLVIATGVPNAKIVALMSETVSQSYVPPNKNAARVEVDRPYFVLFMNGRQIVAMNFYTY